MTIKPDGSEMKLWVAEDVLSDYTSGMACVFAENEQQAIEKLYEKDSTNWIVLYDWLECDCIQPMGTSRSEHAYKHHKPTRLPPSFKLITQPEAFMVSGGG